MRWVLLLLALVGLVGAAPLTGDVVAELKTAQIDEPPLEDPPDAATAQARTDRLNAALRCPVCQGLSVSDSPSDAARAMGGRINELVKMGYTEDQITGYFVDRYGAWVELAPPKQGLHQLLYGMPLLVLVAGVLFTAIVYRQLTARRREDAVPTEVDDDLEPYRARILAELGEGQ